MKSERDEIHKYKPALRFFTRSGLFLATLSLHKAYHLLQK